MKHPRILTLALAASLLSGPLTGPLTRPASDIPGTAFVPFVWDEVLVDLSGLGFNQNRAALGVGARLSDATRLDLAYLLRSRATAAGPWEQDHVLNLTLYFAPRVEPLIRPEPLFRRHPERPWLSTCENRYITGRTMAGAGVGEAIQAGRR